jgi:IclR family acetate operon transcriptional repressor
LTAFTDATVTDRKVLRARLAEIRQAGVVINVDEFIAGASGIAAPILDREGVPVAACTVIGPTARLLAQKDALSRWVKAAAAAVSRALGGKPGAD